MQAGEGREAGGKAMHRLGERIAAEFNGEDQP
jgi:hypothetical protein